MSTAYLPGGCVGTCPMCGSPAQQAHRYPQALCLQCTEGATCAEHGLPAALGGAGSLGGGLLPGHLAASGSWDVCTGDGRVLVRGRACRVSEARFGGTVVEPAPPTAGREQAASTASRGHLRLLGERLSLDLLTDPSPDGLHQEYLYSPDMRYRYAFARWWGSRDLSATTVWVLLNPATGDTEQRRRPTLERCVSWSRSWGAEGLVILNLFAYRATNPRVLRDVIDPIGPVNDRVLARLTAEGERTVVAWGAHGRLLDRSRQVARVLNQPYCLGQTRFGEPRHPLYVASTAALQPWSSQHQPA